MEKIENYLPSVNLVSAHHSPGFYWELQEKKIGEKSIWNEYSVTFHFTCRPLRERECCFCKSGSGTLGFYRTTLFFSGICLEAYPSFTLFLSSNPHQTCLTVWTQRRPLTRLQNSFICGLRRSNLDLIKAVLLIPCLGQLPWLLFTTRGLCGPA